MNYNVNKVMDKKKFRKFKIQNQFPLQYLASFENVVISFIFSTISTRQVLQDYWEFIRKYGDCDSLMRGRNQADTVTMYHVNLSS